MSTEHLLDQIRAAPEDDAPRLALADLLADRGEADRAELIRVQCERATVADPARAAELAERERELLRAHESAWLADWAYALDNWRWERGFLERVALRLERVPDVLPGLLAREPVIRLDADEETTMRAEALERAARCPDLRRIRILDLSEAELGAPGIRAVLASPHLRGLEVLAISDDDSTPAVAEVVAETLPPGVRTLRFVGYLVSSLGDDGAALLAASPRLAGLHHLDLLNALVGPRGAQALAASPHLGNLRRLHLGGGNYSVNRIGPEGAHALGASTTLAGLAQLSLDYNRIGDDGLEALAASRTLRALDTLVLVANEITDDGFKFLAVSDVLDSVRVLDLGHNRITSRGLGSLLRAAPPRLTHLWLRGNPLEGRGARVLANAPWSAQLEALSLAYARVDGAGAQALVDSPHLNGQVELDLQGNPIGEAARAALHERFERVRA